MRIETSILNITTGEVVFRISEADIDTVIAHLRTAQRHLKTCLYCGEPIGTDKEGYCNEICREAKTYDQMEDQSLHV
jgi:recombinational DNA repair protein RecR